MKFIWTKIKQDAFEEIKRVVYHDVLSDYPFFNGEFNIYTNASAFHVVAVINQIGKLISFCTIKLASGQMRYIVTNK